MIERLPGGYDTELGKWFVGGTDLRVGESQRIALARAFLRDAPIIVPDEPTSAVDQWAEGQWLQKLRREALGRTVLLITHRFSIGRAADMIGVMDAGEVVETVSHQELMKLGGRYAEVGASWGE